MTRNRWINNLRLGIEAIKVELTTTKATADLPTEVERQLYNAEEGLNVALDAMRRAINLGEQS